MFRFYLQWDGQNYIVMNDTIGQIGKVWRRTQCDNLTTPFIEMVMRKAPNGFDMTFIGMQVDAISGMALHAANDQNQGELKKREETKNDMNEFKYKLQKLIDMKCSNGVEFMESFDNMLEQMESMYPIKQSVITKNTLIIG